MPVALSFRPLGPRSLAFTLLLLLLSQFVLHSAALYSNTVCKAHIAPPPAAAGVEAGRGNRICRRAALGTAQAAGDGVHGASIKGISALTTRAGGLSSQAPAAASRGSSPSRWRGAGATELPPPPRPLARQAGASELAPLWRREHALEESLDVLQLVAASLVLQRRVERGVGGGEGGHSRWGLDAGWHQQPARAGAAVVRPPPPPRLLPV